MMAMDIPAGFRDRIVTHDDLARSLADHLRTEHRMTWCDMQLGPAGSPRPDVYAIFKSFRAPQPTAYEVKVSRADFLADVAQGKWTSYLKFAEAVVFATPAGLIGAAEVPPHCGLMVHNGTSWRTRLRATRVPVEIPQEAWLKLLIDGVEREGPRRAVERADNWSLRKETLKRFTSDVAAAVVDLGDARSQAEYFKEVADTLRSRAECDAEAVRSEARQQAASIRGQLCALLQLPDTAAPWELNAAMEAFRRSTAEHPAVTALNRLRHDITGALQRNQLPPVEGPRASGEVEK